MVNATMIKFGYPATRVAQTEYWTILLRPKAVTLGSLVLAARHEATAYADIPAAAHADLGTAIHAIESALTAFVAYEKINYLMLMMVDPHVHYHVIPRYAEARTLDGIDYPDTGWPGIPDLASGRTLDESGTSQIIDRLHACGLDRLDTRHATTRGEQ